MNQFKSLFAVLTALICFSSAYAYKARVENRTSGDITVSINLAACRPIQVGVMKSGQTSETFETGACCFESVTATGTSGAIKNISSGDVRPWNENTWQCFRNLLFIISEKREGMDGKPTGLIINQKVF
jgi:hypothetical protein